MSSASSAVEDFKHGMRRLAAGVVLITTGRPGARGGLTATAAMSLTAEPPQLVVAVNHSASAFPLIRANRSFAVNVLPSAHAPLAEIFAGRTGKEGEGRFTEHDWIELVTGSPILPGAVVSFDCRLAQEFEVATHSLLVGAVEAVHHGPEAGPLLHYDRAWAAVVPAEITGG